MNSEPAATAELWPSTVVAYSVLPNALVLAVGSESNARPADYVVLVWCRHLVNAFTAALLSLVSVPTYAQRQEPGEWLSGRGGPTSAGASSRRLGWDRLPEVVGAHDLKVGTPLDFRSVLAVAGRGVDSLVFVNDGSALMAYDAAGICVWRTDGVGVGELIDVADLDGDGRVELIFSALQRLQFDYNAATGPGRLLILDAHSGSILWTHRFEGLEFGFNRRRTLVASVDGGRTRSIFGVLTYSPSLWRIDYARETGGRIAWKSEPLAYDSPDAAPHLSDLDTDGRPEIVVDSNGRAYVLDVQSGRILASDTYTNHFTFSGFLDTAATSEGRVLFDVSNSAYGKSVAAFRFDGKGGLRRLWGRTWDSGLEVFSTDLSTAATLVHVAGQALGVWSVAPAQAPDTAHVVQAVDPASGAVVFSAPLGRLIDVLDSSQENVVIVTTSAGGVRFTSLSAHGFAPLEFVEAATWLGASRGKPPSELVARPWASAGLLRRASGSSHLVRTTGQALRWQQVTLPPMEGQEHAVVAELPDGALLLTGGGFGLAVGDTGVRQLFSRAGPLWATPLVGQLDEDAGFEVVVPYGKALARFDFTARHAATVTPFSGRTLLQERETFHIPAIAAVGTPDRRLIVSYEYSEENARLLVGRHARGSEVWRFLLDQTAGELSIVTASPRPDGDVTVFQHDNHGTRAIDARTGRLLWTKERIGQCQRQIAAVDWNLDGIDDVALQSGDVALVLDGRDGRALFERPLAASYGAYVATGGTDRDAPWAAMVNAGGLGLFEAGRLLVDEQVQPRGLEMIPLVVGPWGPDHRDHLFMATGSGQLSIVGLHGGTVANKETGLQILTVTGAFVDDDETIDLLVSTMEGELVALAGSTMNELWRLGLGGLGGPAVATDVDGDGISEIVLVSSDGRLLVIAPRTAGDVPTGPLSGDTDGDGVSDEDEHRFGLSLDVPDALLDSDGDGISNGDEVTAGTHPRGLWTSYLPGGVTSTFFRTSIAIANPSPTSTARVLVRLQASSGAKASRLVQLAPHSRWTLQVAEEIPGFESEEFGVIVEADVPVAVDGTQSWGTPTYGAAAERGVTGGAASTWYLAEGATHSGFDLFYMIQNPGTRQAELAITFLRPAGQSPLTWRGTVEPGRRFTLHVNRIPGLESTDVSGIVDAVNGVPVLVQRSMFLTTDDGPLFKAGHESAAVREPATEWFLAEGATGPYFDTFVLIANPSRKEAVVEVMFLTPAARTITQRLTIPPLTRHTIWVDHADPALADTAVSTRVVSVNGVGVVVERAMWWPGTAWQDGHASAAATRPGTVWAFAEGEEGGQRNAATYLLVANATSTTATVRLRLLFEDGTTVAREFVVRPNSRTNLSVVDEFPASADRKFGGVLESLGTMPVPVVLERAMYWDGAGSRWLSGTAALGTRLH